MIDCRPTGICLSDRHLIRLQIVDLKAELFRKEEKFKQDQTSSLGWGTEERSKGNKTLEKVSLK